MLALIAEAVSTDSSTPAGLAVLITALSGFLLGLAGFVMKLRENRRQDVHDVKSQAVKEMETAISHLGRENRRLYHRVEELEAEIKELHVTIKRLEAG